MTAPIVSASTREPSRSRRGRRRRELVVLELYAELAELSAALTPRRVVGDETQAVAVGPEGPDGVPAARHGLARHVRRRRCRAESPPCAPSLRVRRGACDPARRDHAAHLAPAAGRPACSEDRDPGRGNLRRRRLGDARRRRRRGSGPGPGRACVAQDERSQTRNRELALERLAATLREGLRRERQRRPTAPTRASKERRLDEKRPQPDETAGRPPDEE